MVIWLIVVINFLICVWDSFAAGLLWGKAEKTSEKAVAAAAAAETIGFVGLLYTFILIGIGLGILGEGFLIISNVMLGLPIIFGGIVVTIDGWRTSIEEKSIGAGLVSVYNTFATFWDIHVWIKSLEFLKDMGLGSLLDSDDDSDGEAKAIIFIIVVIILALLISIGLFHAGKEKAKSI